MFDESTFPLIENLDEKRRIADAHSKMLGSDEVSALRKRAKTDLFFLAYSILGYKKLSTDLHGDLCNWLKRTEKEQFREVLLPRGHYKTTIVTKAHAIQIALPDDSGTAPWPQSLGPNCRILICHETADSAARFLFEIIQHFTSNPLLMGLFPECVPNPKRNRINKTELELPRSEKWSEPTFDTMGVGGRSQGRHYNYIKCDDLIGDKARDSEVEMKSAKEWFDNIQAFFSDFNNDKLDVCGTRWAVDDLYAHIHTSYGPQLHVYCRGVEETDSNGKRQTIFPVDGEGKAAFTSDKLSILRKNKRVFSAQYANDPREGGAEFDSTWKRFYFWNSEKSLVVPGKTRLSDKTILTNDCDRILLVDPAIKNESGLVMTATDYNKPNFNIFILEAIEKAFSPPQLLDEIFRLVKKWWPRAVVIEEVLFSALFQHILKTEMVHRDIRFRVLGAKSRGKQKEVRVRGLANYFSEGRIYFNESQTKLIEEFEDFGAIKEYHMLDALAYGPEFWRPGKKDEEREFEKERELDFLAGRDKLTGYSSLY